MSDNSNSILRGEIEITAGIDYGQGYISFRWIGTQEDRAEEAESERKLREGEWQDPAIIERIEARRKARTAVLDVPAGEVANIMDRIQEDQ